MIALFLLNTSVMMATSKSKLTDLEPKR